MGFTYDEYGEEIRRLFVPSDDPGRRPIPFASLVVYNEEKNISQLQFKAFGSVKPDPYRDEYSMVVYIDGACRDNGTPNARASYGVYFGPDSSYNTKGLVPESVTQTSTRAEIEALAKALEIISNICAKDFKLTQIKIATDSQFVVNAMSEWIGGWIEDNGKRSSGKEVAHFERLKELHEKLDSMEYGDDGGIDIQFWHIPREMNAEADALANAAFDSA